MPLADLSDRPFDPAVSVRPRRVEAADADAIALGESVVRHGRSVVRGVGECSGMTPDHDGRTVSSMKKWPGDFQEIPWPIRPFLILGYLWGVVLRLALLGLGIALVVVGDTGARAIGAGVIIVWTGVAAWYMRGRSRRSPQRTR